MKNILYAMLIFCCPFPAFSQDISGLWKGTIYSNDTHQSYQYEIVINKEKGKYSGFSQTWYTINEKRYYGIKKVKIRVANDGKVVIQDAELVENNYPTPPPKNIYQLNVLDLANLDAESKLTGPFVTNRTKEYAELTGQISLKRISLTGQPDLAQYLQQNKIDNTLTASK